MFCYIEKSNNVFKSIDILIWYIDIHVCKKLLKLIVQSAKLVQCKKTLECYLYDNIFFLLCNLSSNHHITFFHANLTEGPGKGGNDVSF